MCSTVACVIGHNGNNKLGHPTYQSSDQNLLERAEAEGLGNVSCLYEHRTGTLSLECQSG